jgi:hypothetical protein
MIASDHTIPQKEGATMASIGPVTVGSKVINLHAFSGEVVEQQKSSYTEVTNDNNNYQRATTTHYNKLFIKNSNGEERSIEIVDAGFSARAGSKASMIWGIKQGKEEGPYVAVVNHDTGSVHTIRKPVNDLAGPPMYNMLLIIAAIFIAVGFFNLMSGNLGSALFKVAIGGGGIFWIYKGQKHLLEQIKTAAIALKPKL